MSALGQKRTLKKRKPECPNYPLATDNRRSCQRPLRKPRPTLKNSFLAAGSSAALAKRTYAANSESGNVQCTRRRQRRTSLWKQLVRKTLHTAGHRYLDGGEIVPGRAWLGRYHLDPNNEDGRDHDKGNGLRLAHVQPLFLSGQLLGPNALGRCDGLHIGPTSLLVYSSVKVLIEKGEHDTARPALSAITSFG